jgi:hypothetical protein
VGFFWRELFILNPPPLGGTAILPEYIHYYGLNLPPPGGTAILREYIIILLRIILSKLHMQHLFGKNDCPRFLSLLIIFIPYSFHNNL